MRHFSEDHVLTPGDDAEHGKVLAAALREAEAKLRDMRDERDDWKAVAASRQKTILRLEEKLSDCGIEEHEL